MLSLEEPHQRMASVALIMDKYAPVCLTEIMAKKAE